MDLINDKLSKIYLKYLTAAFGSTFMGSVFGLVDMVMVGQYHGPSGSAAMGVIAPIWNIVYSFGLLAGIGGSVLFSVAKGSDGHGERPANAYFTGSVIFGGIIALLLPIGSYAVAFAAFLVIGFGCAPIYPCIIHSTPDNFGAQNSGAIIGIQMASAYVGSTFVPPLFGLLGNALSFSLMPVYLLIFFTLMIVMTEMTFRITQKEKSRG